MFITVGGFVVSRCCIFLASTVFQVAIITTCSTSIGRNSHKALLHQGPAGPVQKLSIQQTQTQNTTKGSHDAWVAAALVLRSAVQSHGCLLKLLAFLKGASKNAKSGNQQNHKSTGNRGHMAFLKATSLYCLGAQLAPELYAIMHPVGAPGSAAPPGSTDQQRTNY